MKPLHHPALDESGLWRGLTPKEERDMPKKHQIQVRRYTEGDHYIGGKFEIVETITRKPWAENIGNFNPLFCRYKGERYQIHSDAGDVSDPFRREESYAESFFIVPWHVFRKF